MNAITNIERASIGLMLDIETLGKGPDAVTWQIALYGWDLLNPTEILELPFFQYIPIQPQLDLLPARKIDADTLIFWMKEVAKNPELVTDFDHAEIDGIDELQAILRGLLRAFDRMTNGGTANYELWTRGNFDLPIVQTLLRAVGLEAPWDFRKTRDLRTLESLSGVSWKSIEPEQGFVKHRADHDCRFQILHHSVCMQALS